MKRLTPSFVDKVLRDKGMDIVGVEVEFASTIGHASFDRHFLDENNLQVRSLATRQQPRPILADDDSMPRDYFVGYSSPHYDSSISVTDDFPHQLEFTSSPLPIMLVPVYIKDLAAKTKNFCVTTPTCGTHFHFNSNQLTWYDLKHMALGIVAFEPFFYMMATENRISLKYCKPMGHIFTIDDFVFAKDKRDLSFLFVQTKCQDPIAVTKSIGKYGCLLYPIQADRFTNPRYMGLNIYSHFFRGTLEFRYFRNYSWQQNLVFFSLIKRVIARIFTMSNSEIISLIREVVDDSVSPTDYMHIILDLLNFEEDNSYESYMLPKIFQDELQAKAQFAVARYFISEFLAKGIERRKKISEFVRPELGPENNKLSSLVNSGALFTPSITYWLSSILQSSVGATLDGFSVETNAKINPVGKIPSFKKWLDITRHRPRNNHLDQKYLSKREEELLLSN